jgi:phosphoribosylamine--glycine ligase
MCGSGAEAAAAVDALVGGLGAQAGTLLFEERLEGEEVSVIALCDGERYTLLPFAQDFKRLRDGDIGPNTGGMGAYGPALAADPRLEGIGERVIAPTLRAMAARGTPFVGALYAGLMLTAEGVRVLEFNARLGDPECQVLMLLIEEDLLPWLSAAAGGRLPSHALRTRPGAALGVVLAAPGYPESPKRGGTIEGIAAAEAQGARVFHAGTERRGGALVTAGGRVLTVCAYAPTMGEARRQAYAALRQVRFPGAQFRGDIGPRGAAV